MNSRDVLIPFGIMLGLTAAYALFWTLCVQRVNPFLPLPVEEVVERAMGNYEKRNNEEMTPDVLRPRFKNALMNMVLRDLSGWRCEKLTEHSAVLHLNAFTGLSAMFSKNGYSWPVFTVVNSG